MGSGPERYLTAQASYHGWIQREINRENALAAARVQARLRGFTCRTNSSWARVDYRAAVRLQNAWRSRRARQELLTRKWQNKSKLKRALSFGKSKKTLQINKTPTFNPAKSTWQPKEARQPSARGPSGGAQA